MRILIICKASTVLGLGHLSRSKTLAESIVQFNPENYVDFRIIGEPYVTQLLSDFQLKYTLYLDESELNVSETYDIILFDTLTLGESLTEALKPKARILVSISPVFDQMHQMHLIINRTKYFSDEINQLDIKKIGGPKYAIIQKACKKIKTSDYRSTLKREKLSIAISMGGADAANKTLKLLSVLKYLDIPVVFWVMLGEGYKHSYDELVREIISGTMHEIILAKTNHSMWSVLQNTSLLITTSGVTAYEAVYAGLPAIVFYEQQDRFFLVKELLEKGAIINGGLFSTLDNTLNKLIKEIFLNREILLRTHKTASSLIKKDSSKDVILAIERELDEVK